MQDKSSAAAYASDEGTEEIVIPLRPHHGMCLAYFKGEGYSNGFTCLLYTSPSPRDCS